VRDQGIQVIVTDHHALPEKLPPAHAIINPQRLSRDHPLRNLPGVGVAYKVMEGLFSFIGKAFEPGPYLELAALGIVADVAELRADTRFILQKGLINLRHTDRLGLQTLYANANLNPSSINESHIGFQIGPRLNAIGRLGDANPIVEFLITDDSGRSRVMGMQIEATNAKRRFESRQVEKAAEEMLQKSPDDRHAPGIVLHHPDWPGGIVGIVAGHLVEKYQKPVILLTGKDPVHGSARSVEGINIHEVISDCSDLLSNFGGHPMAAGLSMPAQNMVAFKRKFLSKVKEVLTVVEVIPTLEIDQVLKLNEITIDFVNDIQRLAPFGAGFPALRFLIKGLNIVSHNVVGGNGEHRQVLVEDTSGFQQHIIWWNGGDTLLPEAQFDLVCTLSKSDYRGTPQINVEWIDYHLTRKGRKDVARQKYEINDYRQAFDPIQLLLSEIKQSTKCLVWVEGSKMDEINTVTRNEIHKTDTLIIWTTPPTQEVLMSAIQAAKPKRLVVFGKEPNLRKLTPFLEKLAGLAKYTVHQKNGQVNIEELASACAVQRDAVSIGLKIWEARGHLTFVREGFQLSIELTKSEPNFMAEKEYTSILRQLIEESNAYRRFFQESDLGSLLKSS
jgi:single-stranded-DNA-specific exonuclease